MLLILTKKPKDSFENKILLQNTTTEFESIYENLYNNHIHSLEILRKKLRLRIIIQCVTFILFALMLVIPIELIIPIGSNFIIVKLLSYIPVCSLIAFFVLTVINRKYIKRYNESYKNSIISNFVKLINNKLTYKTMNYEIEQDYINANFDNKEFNKFTPDDYIEGYLADNIFLKMSDVFVQYIIGYGKHRHVENLFQGIFAFTSSNKNINTYIKISKNKLKIANNEERVEMDNTEFEKYFDIYSENKILTMRILTSDVMQTLIDFHDKYNLDFEIIFRNNTVYLRFFTGSMFEPKVFGSSIDKQLLFIYFCILKFILEITTKINDALQEIEF